MREQLSHPKTKSLTQCQQSSISAIQVFAYLLAARKRCKPSARMVEPTETHLKEITRCLREGIDAKDLLHVVDVKPKSKADGKRWRTLTV